MGFRNNFDDNLFQNIAFFNKIYITFHSCHNEI